jgi:hypothetical protein
VPKEIIDALGEGNYQSPDVVGRSVTLLMADAGRHGELVFSECGKFMDLENGNKGYHAMTQKMLGIEEGEGVTEVLEHLKDFKREEEHV